MIIKFMTILKFESPIFNINAILCMKHLLKVANVTGFLDRQAIQLIKTRIIELSWRLAPGGI